MKCDEGHEMQPILSRHNPEASEWYCEKCHKSKLMTDMEVRQHSGGELTHRPRIGGA